VSNDDIPRNREGFPTKEWFHSQGIPAGVGQPDGPSPEEIAEIEREEAEEEALGENLMYRGLDDGPTEYTQRYAPGDKARIVQFINTNLPHKTKHVRNPQTGQLEEKIVDGEIPEKLFHRFFGWLSHNASMSNFDEDQLRVEEADLKIQELEVMMATPRSKYDPQFNSDLHCAVHMAKLRLFQNKEGNERYLSAAEVNEDLRAYKVMKSKEPGRVANALNRVRGRG